MITVQSKYGCLTVLDMGEEYVKSNEYVSYVKKYKLLKAEIQVYLKKQCELTNKTLSLSEMEEQQITWKIKELELRMRNIESKLETHYKCQCKCGKIHYYNAKTIKSNPRYCFYPVPTASMCTYSGRASNATYRKMQKYDGLECVILCDKSQCMPSDDYCDYYNKYKAKQIAKKEEKLRLEIAKIPRVYANNYDVDFVGQQYESLYVEECCNEHLESEPVFSYTQQHNKHWNNIVVYKQYRCRCILCGKEYYINCDKFGIHPPEKYGYHAYYGYWSEVSCDCHHISSFQWIVNKLLIENNVLYQVEYSFSDLYGCLGKSKLRFDFAIFNDNGSIKCLIECQGEQHYMPVEEFGGQTQHDIQVRNDNLKRQYVKKHNIQMIEISYKDKKYEKVKAILKKYNII